MKRQKIRLGDLLIKRGVITQAQMQQALEAQKQSGRKLGAQLIAMDFVTEDRILAELSQQLDVPWVNPNDYWVDPDVASKLPESYARRFSALILEETETDFLVAMADPSDLIAYDEITRVLRCPVRLAVAREKTLQELINLVYRRTDEISNIAEELGREITSADDIDLSTLPVGEGGASAPVVRLLQSLFEDAVQVGASDIHIEPDEQSLRIRIRRDGVLQEQLFRQRNIHAAMVSLLKLMCGLNITERRLPQDGRFQVRVHGRSIDVRLSTLPLQHGEGVVMRLLDHSAGVSSLDQTGMPADILQRLRRLIKMPYGMVLVTGPTGSGKSTTLYGALSEINRPEVKVITVEDPVEYRLPRVNQVHVRESIGLTFARVLRTTLRQDPDIIMVGEMRDEETADIGFRAAITGHLVFSTLHTNDAVSTANRLVDMGVEPYMIAAGLRAVLAQRLLRRICTQCREPYTPDASERAWLRTIFGADETESLSLYQGRGCASCSKTGYSGRIGVFELLEMDADKIDALRRGDQSGFAAACHADLSYEPMSRVALRYAREGITTLQEVSRVLGEADESALRDEVRAVREAAPTDPSEAEGVLNDPASTDTDSASTEAWRQG
ncbi:GspE/PulE family protein [Halorhodospira halophila]|uniref:Type II secretion system protein E n=1 Tax=Halorhodospira halophila (strain DSM 244 / SL1) TaxID=349124 RepID=A1WTV8_HALHL|nr:GspE/PulE family protein [Halorhodospira halophila]ABM61120.1 type II secretion system protein E [Halorhodospira halophila SL1]MBK1730161.1 MSHA biogenesis protein MshE [Halorhodospira halophila]